MWGQLFWCIQSCVGTASGVYSFVGDSCSGEYSRVGTDVLVDTVVWQTVVLVNTVMWQTVVSGGNSRVADSRLV